MRKTAGRQLNDALSRAISAAGSLATEERPPQNPTKISIGTSLLLYITNLMGFVWRDCANVVPCARQ